MKFKIRDAKPEPEEPTLELWLEERHGGAALVVNSYTILLVRENGITRISGCLTLGLPCDSIGRVKDLP